MTEPAPDSAATSAAAAARHADRYGTKPPARRTWVLVVLGIGVLVAGVGVAFLGFQKYGPKAIETEQLGYVVVDDATLTVRMKVTRDDPRQPVVCFVRAMDRDSAEVGRREVLVPGSDSTSVQVTTTVRSSARPSAGDIYGCTDQVPGYLRAE
ncbi:hypothetical protein ATM97_24540 [Nocardia sp. MH4]|jgi:hypothetical protein|uniref:DUF4307 domain-containing protein n=1 Tax=unclassified Nocardia TaxID=2637762 RepID=UPI001C4E7F2F|nr:DUF4307 domain-containing protein [Nocardia sp. MH4]MBW0273255.1 hypothetical protein [Nocardia sp. MH4]